MRRRGTPGRLACAIALALTGVISSAALTGCTVNPTTGESQLLLFTLEEETALGVQAAPQLTQQYGGAVGDNRLQAYVDRVGQSLLSTVGQDDPRMAELPWTFTLLNSDVINAFALPGGKVFVSRGLAEQMENEAELASVIGHEIGHVTARHGGERISNSMMLQIGLSVVGGLSESELINQGVQTAVGTAGQGFLLKFGRDDELQADELGMMYMSRVGYDPRAAMGMMTVLLDASRGGSRDPEWWSTHPYPETRLERMQALIDEKYADTRGEVFEDRYQRQFLSRLAQVPRTDRPRMLLASSSTWCLHCANGGSHAHGAPVATTDHPPAD